MTTRGKNNRVRESISTRPFLPFLTTLEQTIHSGIQSKAIVNPLLDGAAGRTCIEMLPEATVSELGAFFTPSRIAELAFRRLRIRRWRAVALYDPSCGAGDLLLQAARKLPMRESLSRTLALWNRHLIGTDISAEFVAAAKLRLILLGMQRGAKADLTIVESTRLLTNITVSNGLTADSVYRRVTHVLMNPPFNIRDSHSSWKSGGTNQAAVFLHNVLSKGRPNLVVSAILPEVLRSGSSYAAWRREIQEMAYSDEVFPIGLFSSAADVDVYSQTFRKREARLAISVNCKQSSVETIHGHFEINVGPVVPHRHGQAGRNKLVAFIHARNVKAWTSIKIIRERRRFSGRVFTPPFVVVLRTSRPGTRYRAKASLILGSREVAVENHLLILRARDSKLSTCRKAIKLLKSRTTDQWLDKEMRCRHLTVDSIGNLPWQMAKK